INGKPLIQRNIEYLKAFGFKEFVINIHHYAPLIKEFLNKNDNFGVHIQLSEEEKLLETGGGLLQAQQWLKEAPFLVMNADILTDMDLNEFIIFHQKEKPLVSLAVSDRKSTRKLLFNTKNTLCGWKDLRNGEEIIKDKNYTQELAFSGIHIIEPQFFELNPFHGKFSIMKPYMHLMGSQIIKGFDHTGSKLLDVGKPESIAVAETLFK
ncbi:MAG: nucleotidyltransferase family protein, partial [Weeksellaceae bacterium]